MFMITKKQIERINYLAQKSKKEGLDEQERLEQKDLRQQYINSMKDSLTSQLDNTYVLDENSNKVKLKRKGK